MADSQAQASTPGQDAGKRKKKKGKRCSFLSSKAAPTPID